MTWNQSTSPGCDAIDVSSLQRADLEPEAARAFEALSSHLQTGRGGRAWCRWAVESIQRHLFLIGDARGLSSREPLDTVIEVTARAFMSSAPNACRGEPELAKLSTLTVLLQRNLPLDESEATLHRQRPSLLRRGLMAALLHPASTLRPLTPGPDGRPYQLDWPFLTVRWAMAADAIFVSVNPELRRLLDAWLHAGHAESSEER